MLSTQISIDITKKTLTFTITASDDKQPESAALPDVLYVQGHDGLKMLITFCHSYLSNKTAAFTSDSVNATRQYTLIAVDDDLTLLDHLESQASLLRNITPVDFIHAFLQHMTDHWKTYAETFASFSDAQHGVTDEDAIVEEIQYLNMKLKYYQKKTSERISP